MTESFESFEGVMRRAVELAAPGGGRVEPNPAVGAVVVDDQLRVLGEGWHGAFGGPHAEVEALQAAGELARGATLVVTLEPCRHHGQTPPCTDAVLASGIRRVVVGIEDPSPHAGGSGLSVLRDAGVEIEVGAEAELVRRLNSPFLHLLETGRPWVHAKWAMTLDGRIATAGGHSQWISSEESRGLVHELRGRVDAVVVGIGTAAVDDPLLTARPPGPRRATRVVLDTNASLKLDSQLVRTAHDTPVLVACSETVDEARAGALAAAGVDIVKVPLTESGRIDFRLLMDEFGTRRWTNVLVEGGSEVLGTLADGGWIDEAHVFLAPKLVGGRTALGAVGGEGLPRSPETANLECVETRTVGQDVYWRGVRPRVVGRRDS
ncbi:MAG: bifunctional diaminohydroxyphosphoribosylaminopyrimidine deaminase/5-amino-6-(5-phosphoribosylamino)uracil reductase RibD, partial [Planctomycetota bacterium]|nr:bifunctional diaminohydroxyphosphoribosylaminopyrimidine deaminase/5-amino-6-(5-phosphoribosylamino)uracil reductase RibD [Planctomycetota bacterium]